jgi:hypothetical protein
MKANYLIAATCFVAAVTGMAFALLPSGASQASPDISRGLARRPSTGPTSAPTTAPTEPPLRTNVHLKNYCGPSCLTAFLRMNGVDASLSEIAVLCQTGPRGTSMLGLKNAAEAKGMHAMGAQVTSSRDLKRLGYPCIAFVRKEAEKEADHFILITGFAEGKAKVVEPPRKPYLLATEELDRMLEGRVLLLSRSPIEPMSGWRSRSTWVAGGAMFGGVVVGAALWLRRTGRAPQPRGPEFATGGTGNAR